MKEAAGLHKEVVTGIVQVIKHLPGLLEKGKGTNLGELYDVGCRDRSKTAQLFIFEFIKDGVVNLTREQIKEVADGNYEMVWAFTNTRLQGFGYAPVSPEPKEVDEPRLPDGYSLEKKKVGVRDYTVLYKNEKIILSLPTEYCPAQKIKDVIQQTKDSLLNPGN